jgi:hypothetical protein
LIQAAAVLANGGFLRETIDSLKMLIWMADHCSDGSPLEAIGPTTMGCTAAIRMAV